MRCAIAKEKYRDISCLEEWLEGKGWSLGLPIAEQERLEAGFGAEYGNVRAALWERHYLSLDSAERALLDADTHPSCSWNFAEEAKSYLEELRAQIAGSGFITEVEMSYYHGNTIVFTVWLNRNLSWREYRKVIPEFYRGFQVFVVGPSGAKATDV